MSGIMMMHMAHKPAAVSNGSMRALLSASGQTAYDAAATNNWFSVSAADYAAVAGGLASVTKYALSDALVAENGSAWSGGYAQAFPSTIGTVPSGVYLFGFISRTQTGGTSTPLISTTFRGTYTAISNSPNAAVSGARGYFLRKPSAATAATSYIGIVNSATGLMGTTTSNVGAGTRAGYATTPYSSRTDWNGIGTPLLIFQMLGSPTVQW